MPGGGEGRSKLGSEAGEAATVQWTSLPVRDDFPRSLVLIFILAAIPPALGWWLEGAAYGLVGVLSSVLLLASVSSYFVPTRYVLDERGARATRLGRERSRSWSEVRNLYFHRDGVFLSAFAEPSRLDPFRGIYLRYRGNGEEVRRFCERYVKPAPPSPTP